MCPKQSRALIAGILIPGFENSSRVEHIKSENILDTGGSQNKLESSAANFDTNSSLSSTQLFSSQVQALVRKKPFQVILQYFINGHINKLKEVSVLRHR